MTIGEVEGPSKRKYTKQKGKIRHTHKVSVHGRTEKNEQDCHKMTHPSG
jgi:hypothetical protein